MKRFIISLYFILSALILFAQNSDTSNILSGLWNPENMDGVSIYDNAFDWGTYKLDGKKYYSTNSYVYFDYQDDGFLIGGSGGYVIIDTVEKENNRYLLNVHYSDRNNSRINGKIIVLLYSDEKISFSYQMPPDWPNFFWVDSSIKYVRAKERID